MAKKTRLTTAAVKIGSAVGWADRTARKAANTAQVARKKLTELSKKIEGLESDLKNASRRRKSALR